jgi:hypothetical protein
MLKNNFVVKGIREEKQLRAWFDEQVGVRNAKVFTEKGQEPYVVSFQSLDKHKSLKQNNAFYGLTKLFFLSGCYSCEAKTLKELRKYYKKEMGLIRSYVYFNGEKIIEVKNKSDIPSYINLKACWIILESFSRATRKQAREGIDLIKKEMLKSKIGQTTYAKEFWRVINELEN